MMLNPYASFLGALDPVTVIRQTPQQLADLIAPLSPAHLQRTPAPGKWSIHEIICHLADTEMVFAFRLRQTLSEDHHIIQPYNQDRWASRYSSYETSSALDFFAATRDWNCRLITATSSEDFTRPVTHPERGTMTFRTIVETMAGHDRSHLARLNQLKLESTS